MLTTLLLTVLVASTLVTGNPLPPAEEEEVRSAVVLNQLILQNQIVVLQEMDRNMKDMGQLLNDFSCPYPYVQVLDECFYLSDSRLNWISARNYCQGMKGDLASPKNLYALKSYILKHFKGEDRIWVGSTDAGQEGIWNWLDGRPVDREDFHVDQPDNYNGKEHCLDITTHWHPTLNDLPCNFEKLFVCQYINPMYVQ